MAGLYPSRLDLLGYWIPHPERTVVGRDNPSPVRDAYEQQKKFLSALLQMNDLCERIFLRLRNQLDFLFRQS